MWKTVLSAAFVLGSSLGAQAQFVVDVSSDQVRKDIPLPYVSDLAVGEVGLIGYPRLCVDIGKNTLLMDGRDALETERNEYGVTYRVQRQPGGSITLESIVGPKSGRTAKATLQLLAVDLQACGEPQYPWEHMIEVAAIDGHTSLSALLSAP